MKGRNYLEDLSVAAAQKKKEREYWLKKLSGELVKSFFPFDYKNTGASANEPGKDAVTFGFSQELSSALMRVSNRSDHALHIILISGLVVLLGKYTGHRDIIVGTPIYKQEKQGKFINTLLPVRAPINDGMTFKQLLSETAQTVVEADVQQNYPVEILVKDLGLPFNEKEFPLFDIVILLESIHDKSCLEDCPTIRKKARMQGTGEYEIRPYKRSRGARRGEPCVHPEFSDSLLDISHEPDENIKGNPILQILLKTLKYIFKPGLKKKLTVIINLFKEIKSKRQARVYLVTLIKYLMSSAGNLKKEEIEAPVSRVFSEGGEIMATIAEQLIDQGIDKGIDKGKWDMVMKMLVEGISIDIISKVSGFTADQIREFEKKIQYQQENAAA